MHCAQLSHLMLKPCYFLMTATPIKRVLRCSGYVRLADGTRNPVQIVAQRTNCVWVKVSRPTRLPGGRILQPGGVRASRSDRPFVRALNDDVEK